MSSSHVLCRWLWDRDPVVFVEYFLLEYKFFLHFGLLILEIDPLPSSTDAISLIIDLTVHSFFVIFSHLIYTLIHLFLTVVSCLEEIPAEFYSAVHKRIWQALLKMTQTSKLLKMLDKTLRLCCCEFGCSQRNVSQKYELFPSLKITKVRVRKVGLSYQSKWSVNSDACLHQTVWEINLLFTYIFSSKYYWLTWGLFACVSCCFG